jgi:hypothetical protein
MPGTGGTVDHDLPIRASWSHRRRLTGANAFQFLPGDVTFTPGMAKRSAPGPFAAAPIGQGLWAAVASGECDDPYFLHGNEIAQSFHEHLDLHQGTIVLWITPEWDGNDGIHRPILGTRWLALSKSATNNLGFGYNAGAYEAVTVDASGWTAGTTYCVVLRWDVDNTLDGTNHLCLSVNDAHAYAITSLSLCAEYATFRLGRLWYAGYHGNTMVEGLTIYRRPLFDGTNGIDAGNGDELAAIYAAGAGADPTLLAGSADIVFCLPTDSSVGPLASGTGEAWSHPHSSNLLGSGGFMADGTYTNDGWADEGTPTAVAALAATEKIYLGGYKVTSDAADEGIYKDISVSAGDDIMVRAIAHSDGSSIPKIILYDQTNTAEIASLAGTSGSTRAAPDILELAAEMPAGCTILRVKLINTDATATDVTYWHQAEVLANLWDDPGMESGTAPTNVGTPSTSAQDSGQAHTATNSWKVVADAANEGIKRAIPTTSGKYNHASAWVYADTSGTVDMEGPTLQDGSTTKVTTTTNDAWERLSFVFQATGASTDLQFTGNAAQTFYVDDVAVCELDDVSLTIMPASQSNSTDGTGLRIDGRDTCTQPITGWGATRGAAEWRWTPRHDAADLVAFDESGDRAYLCEAEYDGNNRLAVYASAANTITLEVIVGAMSNVQTWDCTGAIEAGITYKMRIEYDSASARLYVDDVLRVTNTPGAGIGFGASIPNVMNWGSNYLGASQGDAAFNP